MTFSIVAFDPGSDSWGVAVASKCLAVGQVVPWGRAGVGAVATQARANICYGPDGLRLLEEGRSASETVDALVGPDPLASHRQLGVVDRAGRSANFTGEDCLPWCGGITEDEIAVQGNLLAGEAVVKEMAAAYRAHPDEPFARRLVHALVAGDTAGGDRRGRQSAAMRVWRHDASYGGGLDIALDLRVDDHENPVAELMRLERLHFLYFGRPEPDLLLDLDGELRQEVEQLLARLGYTDGDGFEHALSRWIGTENFEEREVAGKIDPLVLDHLRRQAGSTA